MHDLEGKVGQSVMEVIRDSGLPIRADCGGALACATCHVIPDVDWRECVGPAGDDESDLLEGSDYRTERSRLSCSIRATDELDGLTVTLQLDALEG